MEISSMQWPASVARLPWQRWLQRAPLWVNLLLILLLAQLAAQVTWSVFVSEPSVQSAPPPRAAATGGTSQARLRSVADLHLFGTAPVHKPAEAAPISAPDTKLKLVLHGVFASDDAQQAMAIIADSRKEEKVYRLGDTLQGGAKVHTIYTDRVILERSGRYETLKLPRDNLPEQPVVVRAQQALPQTDGPVRRVSATAGLRKLRETLINDPQAIWKDMRIEPVLDPASGSIKGYHLSHKDKQVMRGLGIRRDDIIIAVNGAPMNDPSVLADVFNQLKTAQEISLTLERKGVVQTVVVSM